MISTSLPSSKVWDSIPVSPGIAKGSIHLCSGWYLIPWIDKEWNIIKVSGVVSRYKEGDSCYVGLNVVLSDWPW